jgi:hypothetical protein
VQTMHIDFTVTEAFTLLNVGRRLFGFTGTILIHGKLVTVTPVYLQEQSLHGIFAAIKELVRVHNRIRFNSW